MSKNLLFFANNHLFNDNPTSPRIILKIRYKKLNCVNLNKVKSIPADNEDVYGADKYIDDVGTIE